MFPIHAEKPLTFPEYLINFTFLSFFLSLSFSNNLFYHCDESIRTVLFPVQISEIYNQLLVYGASAGAELCRHGEVMISQLGLGKGQFTVALAELF